MASLIASAAFAGALATMCRRRARASAAARSHGKGQSSHLDALRDDIRNSEDLPSERNLEEAQKLDPMKNRILALRIILGVGVAFGAFQAPWQALPVLIDRKIAADPALPLSESQLKISETFVFVGWLLGAVALHPLMQRLDLKQVLVLLGVTMLFLSVASITGPYVTMLSMTLLCGVRLLHGMCLNIQGVQYMYMQNCFPGYGSQLCAMVNTLYALVAVLMAMSCGTLTLSWDWRPEALIWFGLPMVLGLFVAFPDLLQVVFSLPSALARSPNTSLIGDGESKDKSVQSSGLEEAETMSRSMYRDLCHLSLCFACTVFAYYGLSYSPDSLSTNPFLSAWLINASDILACVLSSRAGAFGRNRAQIWGFLVAGVSLVACALGTVDSVFVISMAILARVALSVVFVTIYVALAEVFPPWCQKTALPTCEIMARVGGCFSPSVGALPVHLSLPLFGLACLLAARASAKLPDKYAPKQF
ncbi:SLC22A6 [Symbiodinium necroappetens]|uniref:SLC22A6 protein n=1 Tax=Symbiodinium necroappetens TaxID=1628268 RepID=A0A812TJS2_9DINO|nr:SLC22A6 [Symbiodinium necroappetens]